MSRSATVLLRKSLANSAQTQSTKILSVSNSNPSSRDVHCSAKVRKMHCFALFLQDAQNAQVLEFAAQNSAKLCILRKNGQNIAKQRKNSAKCASFGIRSAKQRKIGRFWTRKNIAQKCTMHIPASK
jgi:hypothetical protein